MQALLVLPLQSNSLPLQHEHFSVASQSLDKHKKQLASNFASYAHMWLLTCINTYNITLNYTRHVQQTFSSGSISWHQRGTETHTQSASYNFCIYVEWDNIYFFLKKTQDSLYLNTNQLGSSYSHPKNWTVNTCKQFFIQSFNTKLQ